MATRKAKQPPSSRSSRGAASGSLWQDSGTFFPVLAWDTQHGWKKEFPRRAHGLESIRDCGFPLLPGLFIKEIKSNAPIMVGEFASAAGAPMALIVNMSLAKSAKYDLATSPVGTLLRLDAVENAPWKALRNNNEFRLTAGHGCLVKLA